MSGEVLRSWEAHPGEDKYGNSGVKTVAISGDGSKIVSGGFDGLVK